MITDLISIKRQMGIAVTETTDDDILFELQKTAEKKAIKYCGREFESQLFTEYYNGDNTGTLIVNNMPITAITSIHDDIDRVYGADTLIDSDDYSFNADIGAVELDGFVFVNGINNIKIIYTAGYSELNMPDDLKTAIASLVAADYLEKKASINAVSEGEAIYRPDKLRKEAYKTLDLYKKVR